MYRRRRRCQENAKRYRRCGASAESVAARGGSMSHSSGRRRSRSKPTEGRGTRGRQRGGTHVLDSSFVMLEHSGGGVRRGGAGLKYNNHNRSRSRVATSATALLALVCSLASDGALAQQVGNLSGGTAMLYMYHTWGLCM